jgi:3-deoxy-D-manno-octulosonate 8-phosphate phosphatase (KDO 8-P phosphatase)
MGYPGWLSRFVITGGRSEGAKKRLTDLGIEEYYSNVKDKTTAFRSFLEERQDLKQLQICYMGDDLPDLPVLRSVRLPSVRLMVYLR